MSEFVRRTMITLPADLEAAVSQLRQERFSSCTQAEMFRYLIRLGLSSVQKAEKDCARSRRSCGRPADGP